MERKVTVRKPARKQQSKDVHMGMEVSNPKESSKNDIMVQSGVGQRHDLAVADCNHGVLCFGSLRGISGFLRIPESP